MTPLGDLTPETRSALIRAFEAGRLSEPYNEYSVQRYTGVAHAAKVAAELSRLAGLGMTPVHLAEVVKIAGGAPPSPVASLVWSGPDDVGAETRDTGVVMRELFHAAQKSVLLVGFAVYQGKRIFRDLAAKMDRDAALVVRMCLHVERPKDAPFAPAEEIAQRFADRFRSEMWPGARVPEIYFDPRTLAPLVPGQKRVSLHAKVVVVDEARSLVTSANFTEAAQERNIEAGALLDDASFARSLVRQIDGLIARGALQRLPAGRL